MDITIKRQALARLLQLASPTLPVGAFSYSEGLETLVSEGVITDLESLMDWLLQELRYGGIRLETAVAVKAAQHQQSPEQLRYWNQWLSAARGTRELQQQSWQMGRALVRLAQELHPELVPTFEACGSPCNFAVAFGIVAAHWEINVQTLRLAYLQSWATNLVGAAVKLVPLGQTDGQRCLLQLVSALDETAMAMAELSDDELWISSWGAAIASARHETLYSRLFRS